MANTKISALTALTNPTWSEEFVYAYNNANGKVTLNTMKSFIAWWGGGVTTLNADANIWELAAWFYESEYKLFYKSWEDITNKGTYWTSKTLIFVIVNTDGGRWYFALTEKEHSGSNYFSSSCFGYSKSSADWEINYLDDKEWALKHFGTAVWAWATGGASWLADDNITQLIDDAVWTSTLTISSQYPPYKGVPYTIVFNTIKSGETYTVALGTWVTNPLGITLPSASNKKSVITLMPTSATTAIITGCTIAN